MQRFAQFVAGVVVGAAVGFGLGLLLTPRKGEDARRLIRERAEAILAEGREAASATRLELTARLEELKQGGA